ncbi:hypothetical protein QSV08_03355 [Maribacter sp. BPC-D8]|uniref:hypothetical protein n=1 Tax=Maribacter sp. BPC-D8 TaxID=3053613 RepID=UPI002B471AF5|nr:hypothetical protein [Maribacter sp. BPC-D8]WRI30281.1 hypothetical protein QSV08_03355 [Maribacter sp. BPC-D8]
MAIVVIPLCILAIPVMLAGIPIHYFQRKNFEKKYGEFLIENNGKNFFCYNNRKNSKQYLEQSILPNLSESIEIVYLDGKRIESTYDSGFISEALYGLKHYNKFPHLMKIRNGKLSDTSINNPFYAVLNMNKSKVELLSKINHFFDINFIKSN